MNSSMPIYIHLAVEGEWHTAVASYRHRFRWLESKGIARTPDKAIAFALEKLAEELKTHTN